MFDFVHKHKRVIQVVLFLIALTFATWGIESYTHMRGGRDVVATVNGLDISTREFQDANLRQQEQLRRLFGASYDPAIFDTPAARRALLDSLIDQRLIASQASRARLTVSDEALRQTITSMPAFQDGSGKFSRQNYEAVLRSQNPPLTPAEFESRMRYEMALAQIEQAVRDSTIAPRTVAERITALENQKREVSEARVPADKFLSQVKVDDAQMKAYYEAHKSDFRSPERLKAQYVVLSADALAAQEQVTPDEVRKQWETTYAPKLRVKEEAHKKVQAIAAEVRKNPSSFAALAKKESQDPGSKDHGGDLGFAPRGSYVKPFEDALFSMKKVGDIVGPVETDFGFHIIELTGIRKKDGKEERRASHILINAPADAKPLDAMRPQIEADLKKQRAAKDYADDADGFSNTAYEQPDSLQPVAQRFKLPIQTSGWLTRGEKAAGPLGNPKLLAALFSADAIQSKRNTDAIEVAPGTLVAARVAEYQPEAQKKFEDVRAEIGTLLRHQQAGKLAEKEGEAQLEALRKGSSAGVSWSAPKLVSRSDPQGMGAEALRAVVSADTSKLPVYVGLNDERSGYTLLRISKVIEADPKKTSVDSRVAQLAAAEQYDAYVANLRAQADIQIDEQNLERR